MALGSGYYLALSVTEVMKAIATFFIAVILVIVGTYLLFNAGITVFLKMLKKTRNITTNLTISSLFLTSFSV